MEGHHRRETEPPEHVEDRGGDLMMEIVQMDYVGPMLLNESGDLSFRLERIDDPQRRPDLRGEGRRGVEIHPGDEERLVGRGHVPRVMHRKKDDPMSLLFQETRRIEERDPAAALRIKEL